MLLYLSLENTSKVLLASGLTLSRSWFHLVLVEKLCCDVVLCIHCGGREVDAMNCPLQRLLVFVLGHFLVVLHVL